jgi:L-2-hydroxyglutarate oxidase LhgO
MYELELEIWARTQNISDSADVVLAKQEEANALFEEIYKRVHQWQSMDVAWKDEDKEYLHEICAAMETRARSTTLFPYLVNYGHSDDDT